MDVLSTLANTAAVQISAIARCFGQSYLQISKIKHHFVYEKCCTLWMFFVCFELVRTSGRCVLFLLFFLLICPILMQLKLNIRSI